MFSAKVVGHRIRKLRTKRKWNQEKLAEAAGVSSNYVGEVERAKVSVTVEVLARIAVALDTTLEDLTRYSEKLAGVDNPEDMIDIMDMLVGRSQEELESARQILEIHFKSIDRSK
ncbi:helix-turn-helix domain-containing protein [Sutcliffiella deserti]|uniref:helix-turn-helix domain-containing protein n=1 Tax=Sutcliffiella deserti TaxID=2875501 RepID=UPI001CBFBB85|nr:helix-turn-helix transcriptional regulator [Sutcliffiella deserti]